MINGFPFIVCLFYHTELTDATFQYEISLDYKASGFMLSAFDRDACFNTHASQLITLSEQISVCNLDGFSASVSVDGLSTIQADLVSDFRKVTNTAAVD